MSAGTDPLYSPTGITAPLVMLGNTPYERKPYTFGIHTGASANAGWMDGHAKNMNVSLVSKSYPQWTAKKLGFLLPSDVSNPFDGTANEHANFYYDPVKY